MKMLKMLTKNMLYHAMPKSKKLRYMTYIPYLRKWREDKKRACHEFSGREALYKFINDEVLRGQELDYLEFGVYKGDSILQWAGLNSKPDSRFHGFDTFTGLPEDWHKFSKTIQARAFDMGGQVPTVADQRVSFYKGLFQETLPTFLNAYLSNRAMVIHFDCDLYSASLYVLTQVDKIAKSGTLIIFDEFTSLLHEFRALEDYCSAYMRSYKVVAATKDDVQIAIQMI